MPTNATFLNSTAPIETEVLEPEVLPVPINATVVNATEPLVTDIVEFPEPTDLIFIDPILSVLPDGTVVDITEETMLSNPVVDAVPPLSPPSKTLDLATFTDLIQGIANLISGLFSILPPDAVAPVTPPVADEIFIPEPIIPEVDVSVAPFPLVNATTNGTVFKRQASTVAAPQQLPESVVLDLIGRILDFAIGLVKSGFITSNTVPTVSKVVGGASTTPLVSAPVKPLLSNLKLDPVLEGTSNTMKRDTEGEPVDSAVVADILKSMLEIITELFSQVTSAAPEPFIFGFASRCTGHYGISFVIGRTLRSRIHESTSSPTHRPTDYHSNCSSYRFAS